MNQANTQKIKLLFKFLLEVNFGKNKKIIRIFGIYVINTKEKSKSIFHQLRKIIRHSPDYKRHYINSLKNSELKRKGPIPHLSDEETKSTDVNAIAIAFYLPQFHPVEINDNAWGKGFTEWANTTTAVPQFNNHYQPRIPGELGYYDLRVKEVQRRQIELAKAHGISGFCYYHYWFDGKRVLERPFNQVLADKSLDFPFCLCWANENWTRAWDASNKEIIIAQRHSPEDDKRFFEDIIPALKDTRYIRIEGKPLLILYRPDLLPDPSQTAKRWRALAKESGIGEIMLGIVSTRNFNDYESIGFDTLIQFPPHNLRPKQIHHDDLGLLNPNFSGNVHDYEEAGKEAISHLKNTPSMIPGIMMGWDNEARRPGRSTIYHNCTPAAYKRWLLQCIEHCFNPKFPYPNPIVFINAWNEWAEGTYLEPDKKHGYEYLKVTAEALQNRMKSNEKN